MPANTDGIWLRVGNARLTKDAVEIQVEGDQGDSGPTWWPVDVQAAGSDALQTYRTIVEGLDKRRIVLAYLELAPNPSSGLECKLVRVQHADSRPS